MADCLCINHSLESKKPSFFHSSYKTRTSWFLGLENYEKSIKSENELLKNLNKIKEMRVPNIKSQSLVTKWSRVRTAYLYKLVYLYPGTYQRILSGHYLYISIYYWTIRGHCLSLYMYILLDYNRTIDDNKSVYITGLSVDKCSKTN